ncbi:LysR family transcriptional regulator [Oceanimonas doudoroffii]|uniref:LysR family transcriptional regulator n=1 Tax=Oceanimonas doudoroffii TaxID=84158 RepID=A0A233RAK8_9GAMM|nr:LysR family transcriptional regulator [Oceanimonas doudoroffii]OXY80416.1 LysR family transcriptional regulator [Oceanimonas doudoroffii]
MSREKALTLDALRVLDAIDRRGSFAAAADELGKVPSALSYTIQKLEDELDLTLFDRSGHRTRFTPVGRLLLDQGRQLLQASGQLVESARALERGWETSLTLAVDGVLPSQRLFPLIEALSRQSDTDIRLSQEILAGSWEALESGRADLIIAPLQEEMPLTPGIKHSFLYRESFVYVAHPEHPIHRETIPVSAEVLQGYRAIAVADTARNKPPLTYHLFNKQSRLTVSTMQDKISALRAGLGISTLPGAWLNELLERGELKPIEGVAPYSTDVVLAWRRDAMGKAKSWLIRQIPALFEEKKGSAGA